MAYLPQNKDDDQQTLGMNQNQSTNAGSAQSSETDTASGQNISGGAASAAPSSMPQQGNQQAKQPASSGTFTNLQSYLSANQNARTGQGVANRLTNQAQGAQGQLKQAQGNFNRQLEAGSLANRGQAVSDVASAVQKARQITVPNVVTKAAQPVVPQNVQIPQQTMPQVIGDAEVNRQITKAETPVQLPPGVEVNQQITTAAPQNQSTMSKFANMMQGQGLAGPVGEPVSSAPSTGNVAASSLFSGSKPSNAQSTATPTQTEAPAAPQPTPEQMNPNRLGLVGDSDVNRFKEVINARYAGPQSLRDSGVYNKLYNRATDTQANLDLSKSGQGREELLSRLYGTAQNPYTRGMSKLDNLLISGNKQAQEQIQGAVKGAGNLKQDLQRAQLQTLAGSDARTKEIQDINQKARDEFSRQQTEEKTGTESRIDKAMADSQEYYTAMNQFLQTDPNAPVDITPEIASMLGIQGNEGFYKIKDLPKQVLERAKMISANEQARQAALSQMAGLDQQRKLDTQQLYSDATKAGTQKSTDIVNTAQLQKDLVDAENQFRDYAAGADITGEGTGKAKYSKGMFRGKGTVNAYASATKNLGDLLKSQGYSLDDVQVGQLLDSDPAIRSAMGLEPLANQESQFKPDFKIDDTGMSNSQGLMGAAKAAGIGALSPAAIGAGVAAGYGGGLAGASAGASAGLGAAGAGAGVGAGLAYLTDADLRAALPGVGQQVGELSGKLSGTGLIDKNNTLGKLQGQAFSEALKASNDIVDSSGEMLDTLASPLGDFGKLVTLGGSNLLGGGKGSAQRKAQSQANQAASANLRKNLLSALAEQGFDRRATTLDQGSIQSTVDKINQDRAQAQAAQGQIQQQLDKLNKESGRYIMQSDAGQNDRLAEINNQTAALKQQLKDSQAQVASFDPQLTKQQGLLGRATKANERTSGIKQLLARMDKTNF